MSAKPNWTYKEVRQVIRESASLESAFGFHGANLGEHWRSRLVLSPFHCAEPNCADKDIEGRGSR